jgi:hypothetical protein
MTRELMISSFGTRSCCTGIPAITVSFSQDGFGIIFWALAFNDPSDLGSPSYDRYTGLKTKNLFLYMHLKGPSPVIFNCRIAILINIRRFDMIRIEITAVVEVDLQYLTIFNFYV